MTYSERLPGTPALPDARNRPLLWAATPAIYTLVYPGFIDVFHFAVGETGTQVSLGGGIVAAVTLVLMLSVPLTGFVFALRGLGVPASPVFEIRARRIAYAVVAAPTMYCMVGVLQILVSSPVPDQVTWFFIWCLGIGWLASVPRDDGAAVKARARPITWLRIAHGITAIVVLSYIAFHLGNHLVALVGPDAHATVMEVGRKIYRSPIGEPILVAAMLFQAISGFALAWMWSSQRLDFYKTFQVASGVFLVFYILGHMNAVFLLARAYFGIPTGWDFATGAPNGLVHDWWSARLIPHYALAVFLVIGHLFSGLRVIMLAHGTETRTANRIWCVGALGGGLLSLVIMLAMCGVRI